MKEMAHTALATIQFDPSMFNGQNGSITIQSGNEIFMEHRLKILFSLLLDREDQVVTRDELMKSVWKDIVVSDESISKAVSDLRKFFVTRNIVNVSITTIPKLGYKLVVGTANTQENRRAKYLKLGLKIALYTLITGVVFIILIRAIRYEQ